jgi:hypothetical protein
MVEEGADHGDVVLQTGFAGQVEVAVGALPVGGDDHEPVLLGEGHEVPVEDLDEGARPVAVELEDDRHRVRSVVGGGHETHEGPLRALEREPL